MLLLPLLAALFLLDSTQATAQAQKGNDKATIARQKIADQGLFFALAEKNIPTMITMRDQGANPNTNLTRLGLTVNEVFGSDAPINTQPFNPRSWPILHWAVYSNNLEAVKILLRSGARVNAPDIYGATALHWAAWGGFHEIGKLLMNNKANCQALDLKKRTPKDWALMVSQNDMIRLIDGRLCNPALPKDSDNDGVYDDMDLCPNTPYGATVDERGCWVVAYPSFFDFDKAIVKRKYVKHIEDAAQIIKNIPTMQVSVQGHTDSVGTQEYNYKLGLRRAEAVKRILEDNGVNPSQLIVISFGKTKPTYSNKSARSRALNRRVELAPVQP